MTFEKKILSTINKFDLLSRGDRVLIAVSGGPDSMALAGVFMNIKTVFDLDFSIAHYNHNVRGNESRKDMEFVVEYFQKMGTPVICEELPVEEFPERLKRGPEDFLRRKRYAFLKKSAERMGADRIATGHTSDDQIETVLLRLVQGAGRAGLSGIPARRGLFIRPLLEVSGREIREYLESRNIPYRIDSTNRELQYPRNRIRSKAVPCLKEINPNLGRTVQRIVNLMRKEDKYLDRKTEEILQRTRSEREENAYDLCGIRSVPEGLKKRLMFKLLKKHSGNEEVRWTLRHAGLVEKLISSRKKRGEIHLPEGLRIEKRDEVVLIHSQGKRDESASIRYEYFLELEQSRRIEEIGFTFRATGMPVNKEERDAADFVFTFDGNLFEPPYLIRNRRPGDRFRRTGMKGKRKKLKDLFREMGMNQEERSRAPVLECGGEILWVAGGGLSESVTKQSDRPVKITILIQFPMNREQGDRG